MKRSFFWRMMVTTLVIVGVIGVIKTAISLFSAEDDAKIIHKNTIVHLDLVGVIMNGKKFIKNLKKYEDEDHVKALVININSPGGAVGPSQEVYSEIKRFREVTKKPVICVSTGIMASGAYYSAVACDKIVVAPGALVGSIGVIMEFANLEKLYDWAKISRYTITSGKYKDSGAEYRSMRDDERALFQSMIDEVYNQFKNTVMESRKLKEETMLNYADGRVFTGAKAVELGFADSVGTFADAVAMAAEASGVGKDYELYEIPKKKRSIFDLGDSSEDDPINSIANSKTEVGSEIAMKKIFKLAIKPELLNQPLYLMPGFWGE